MEAQIIHYSNKLKYEIDSWDLNECLKSDKNVVVIDTRSSASFNAEHISSAVNLPHRLMSSESTAHFDKSFLYVTYCDGIGCNASTKGALALAKLGFTVKELIGGIEWWKRDGYQTSKGETSEANNCGCE
jgi:rhodanese-related sulfurtransferase